MPGFLEIGICSLLVLMCAAISFWRKQYLEKDFLIGSARTFIQLITLGYALTWIFKNDSLLVILGVSLVMTLNSALHSKSRVEVKYKALLWDNFLATALAIWPLAIIGSALQHGNRLWQAEVFLPLLGVLLGNTLNGISVGVDFFGTELKARKEEVISLLALGATPREATRHINLRALKLAMTPTLNSMASMGIVSIPGMMFGQILGGNSPTDAAITQVIIMFLLVTATYSATNLALFFSRKHKFTLMGIPCFE
jgi:putative ABC transport system permease protein